MDGYQSYCLVYERWYDFRRQMALWMYVIILDRIQDELCEKFGQYLTPSKMQLVKILPCQTSSPRLFMISITVLTVREAKNPSRSRVMPNKMAEYIQHIDILL